MGIELTANLVAANQSREGENISVCVNDESMRRELACNPYCVEGKKEQNQLMNLHHVRNGQGLTRELRLTGRGTV